MKRRIALLALAAALGCRADAPPRLTERCNTQPASRVSLGITDTFMENLQALAHADLPRYLAAVRGLWDPQAIHLYTVGGNWFADIEYEAPQDPEQIAAEIRVDGLLRSLGVASAQVATPICLASPTWQSTTVPSEYQSPTTLGEYRNRFNNRYILSDRYEALAIAMGAAGPGWEDTRERFDTLPAHLCNGTEAVHRFYAPATHTHVYTIDPVECGRLRQAGTKWIYEGVAFGAWTPSDGECPARKRPVWRLFNNRGSQDDAAYRHVTRPILVSQGLLQGWVLEGVAFCVNP